MKFQKILCVGYNGSELEKEYWDRIDALAHEKVLLSDHYSSFNKHLKNTDCLLVKLGAKVDRGTLDKAFKLKYIGMFGTGVGGIDIAYAAKRSIAVCNIPNYATEGVAEFTFGAILDYLRELERAKKQARSNNYSEDTFTGTEIKGKRFGVIGLGNIGARTAEIAKGFGAKASYWSKNRKANYEKKGIEYQSLNDLLKSSDIISLNLSLNSKTKNVLDKKRIQMIKKGSLLVNPSPMELLDLDEVVVRLKRGDMAFILDHSDEMTKEQLRKLKPFKNCVIYPPIAYTTKEATELKKEIFTSNLENFLKGSPINRAN